jgi:hypothetical protein
LQLTERGASLVEFLIRLGRIDFGEQIAGMSLVADIGSQRFK